MKKCVIATAGFVAIAANAYAHNPKTNYFNDAS